MQLGGHCWNSLVPLGLATRLDDSLWPLSPLISPITSLIPTSKDRSVGKSLFRKIYIQIELPTVVKPFSSFWVVGGPVLSEPICVALSLRVNSGPLNTQ